MASTGATWPGLIDFRKISPTDKADTGIETGELSPSRLSQELSWPRTLSVSAFKARRD
jgi:hypothetical protein